MENVPAMHNAYRIIIAEDDELVTSLLIRLILRRYPVAVIQAFGNGRAALAAYDQAGADLLLVNHGMPGMDGPTMIRILRARGDSVPIIGMSGNPWLHDEYMAAGAMAFVESVDLIAQLGALLHRFLPSTPHSGDHATHARTVPAPYPPKASKAE
jgi:DNA-binding NarL/FixJ family response regulator